MNPKKWNEQRKGNQAESLGPRQQRMVRREEITWSCEQALLPGFLYLCFQLQSRLTPIIKTKKINLDAP